MVGYKFLRIWKPEAFQGRGKKRNYFEGWYYKLVDEREENVYAIIPGISITQGKEKPHAFIQVINGKTNKSSYVTYDRKAFSYSRDKFEIKIGNNEFSLNKIKLHINNNIDDLKGELNFRNLVPWPRSILSPGTMGWYSFVPFMECYHETISFNHEINGTLSIGNERVDFGRGKGYMEKDWGTSFPSSWIWSQSNHFENPKSSVMISIANIPWLHSHFTGFIVGIWLKDRIIRLTTYTGAKIRLLKLLEDKVLININDKKFDLQAIIGMSDGGKLYSPVKGAMIGEIAESISADIDIELYEMDKGGRKLIFKDKGRNAGLEIVGDLNELMKK